MEGLHLHTPIQPTQAQTIQTHQKHKETAQHPFFIPRPLTPATAPSSPWETSCNHTDLCTSCEPKPTPPPSARLRRRALHRAHLGSGQAPGAKHKQEGCTKCHNFERDRVFQSSAAAPLGSRWESWEVHLHVLWRHEAATWDIPWRVPGNACSWSHVIHAKSFVFAFSCSFMGFDSPFHSLLLLLPLLSFNWVGDLYLVASFWVVSCIPVRCLVIFWTAMKHSPFCYRTLFLAQKHWV